MYNLRSNGRLVGLPFVRFRFALFEHSIRVVRYEYLAGKAASGVGFEPHRSVEYVVGAYELHQSLAAYSIEPMMGDYY